MSILLKIEELHVTVEGNEIIKGLNLEVKLGEVHAIMGPNGSGKSTLAYTLMGKPGYEITKGKIYFQGEDVAEMEPEERAQKGLFLSFQYPVSIPGVTVASFLMTALQALSEKGNGRYKEIRKNFRKSFKEKMELLKVDPSFANRYLNDGFSGGEKKRMEILQLLTLQPTLAILDETDSGLDIDALKIVSQGVSAYLNPERAVVVITHYQRILNHLKPHFVHILAKGNIIASGGPELALELENKGYKAFGIVEEQRPTA
ncbi:MAG: Fe-S cluster assembly ATPase SufC [Deltaproteobacteria bacterium RIFCSPLOWO2_01_44_7]|nr:MAG: Fe-S cluster assembly ATPase SufC [Deltaproteobacteria bacterium RIFCSPHIGHO2_01_FULL_43_49]OGQ14481.1 MAG: Fe-S cluster assembly ATPase SufC [Deltaproteobacteria bacterium RIFCSPHIGHO2_02_FULL_44_53]OGQ27862.1 MAG: Fe-S cluster assembly ATPase SufC [Deltaproteobacteria bacterium RIFCSPHIGHO2_12_FULL_44_21]OGQ30938.1 MAG: Fe-S cluster assembly ATPase SufC [Deltaproteobacteria bacterium RIFCSPLOWO2_01_FULL_45_74]OGQ38961.1 MAG: Fe-S cluster assembly ATPase SufC [Deltaproteobacteria bacte